MNDLDAKGTVSEVERKSGSVWKVRFYLAERKSLILVFKQEWKARQCTLAQALALQERRKQKVAWVPRARKAEKDAWERWLSWYQRREAVAARAVPAILADLPGVAERLPKSECAIYFFTLGDEVVYVGQSQRLGQRLDMHYRERVKKWDSVWTIPCPPELLNCVENWWIVKLKPRHNLNRWHEPLP